MLEQIAQALDVDMTILLYGPPPRPDRQREIRRLAMGAGITALFLAAYGISAGPAADLFSSYFLSLSWLRSTLLLPCVCLGLGWTVFQACGLLLKARPLSGTFGRWLHLVLLAVPICYFVLMAPFFWYLLRISLEVWQQLQTGAGVAHSSSFSYPGILNQLFLSLFRHWKLVSRRFLYDRSRPVDDGAAVPSDARKRRQRTQPTNRMKHKFGRIETTKPPFRAALRCSFPAYFRLKNAFMPGY